MSLVQHLPASRLRPRRREVLPTAAVTAAAAGAATVLATVDPNQAGHYPGCPFLLVSGLYCPGCGSLRAVHDLLHADIADALARNPLAVVAVPFLLYALGAAWARALGRRPPSTDLRARAGALGRAGRRPRLRRPAQPARLVLALPGLTGRRG